MQEHVPKKPPNHLPEHRHLELLPFENLLFSGKQFTGLRDFAYSSSWSSQKDDFTRDDKLANVIRILQIMVISPRPLISLARLLQIVDAGIGVCMESSYDPVISDFAIRMRW